MANLPVFLRFVNGLVMCTDKVLLLDNCARENKNRFVFSWLAALVGSDIFNEVTVDFLVKGHTG